MKKISLTVLLFLMPVALFAQLDSLISKLSFESDFRFRIEQDWNSKKSDGTYRDDRTRFRYRLRAGITYAEKWYNTGFRIRTGNPNKQQDPQLTLGEGFKEFGTLPIGLEKLYFVGKWSTFEFSLGKNTYPFEKNNELFWSDNVFPEGVFVGKNFPVKSNIIDAVNIKAGHFIMSASGASFNQDAYFQGLQMHIAFLKNRFEIFPSLYLFKNIPNIPDGNETYEIDYSIFHIGTRLQLLRTAPLKVEFDYYNNFQDYTQNDSIPSNLKGQNTGFVLGLKYGKLSEKGKWILEASYAYLQQYSAVDFMAQNDWARWDYSSSGSPDGRLTNLKGIELVLGFMIDKKAILKMKYYVVEQLVPYGISKETGSRIRLDLDVQL
ncbi:putative porin [Chondrinema litorale]|uniref:putative porin n=1 Tax=Chondrinema litorale TaxID=2994555 RepID=UPI0025435298|nr:putative porin [Chondrinema litorale]UZR97218.1 putative porin [Chondrinema litorale]